jgi:hypothetical protein
VFASAKSLSSKKHFSEVYELKKLFALMALLFLSVGAMAYPMNPTDTEVANALSYLKSQQDTDGCIGSFATSGWAISSVVAAGQDPASTEWSNSGNSLVDCITKDSTWFNDPTRTATDFERQIVAIVAAGQNPENFGGLDYVAKLKTFYDGTQMGDSAYLNDDQWGIIALIAAGEEASSTEIQGMIAFLEANQGTDDGWSWGVGYASDADSTATAIMALIAAGEPASQQNIQDAVAYLKTQQDTTNAGFLSWGEANPDSTSYSMDGIVALGQDPTGTEWQENGTNPMEYLLTWQQPDGGFSNLYADPPLTSDTWTTANAINALLGKPYPVEVISDALAMQIRIEALDSTLLDEEVELPESIEFTANSGTSYMLTEPSLLMGLLQAAEDNGFEVIVKDDWYPDMGFYVYSIAGYTPAGFDGWNFRVDYHTTGMHSVDSFEWQESFPPTAPHNETEWFFGGWDWNGMRITAASTEVEAGEDVEVTVEYYHEVDEAWYPVEGATVKGASSEQTTDSEGKATISFAFGGTKQAYAEKPDSMYYRSDRLQFTVEGGQQTSSSVELSGTIVPAVSFSVNPSSINFGSFGPGYTVQGNNLTLKNTGSWNLEVEAEVTDNEGTLYTSGLLLDDSPWTGFLSQIAADTADFVKSVSVTTGLAVPEDYSGTGTETGTLTFWATATGIPS